MGTTHRAIRRETRRGGTPTEPANAVDDAGVSLRERRQGDAGMRLCRSKRRRGDVYASDGVRLAVGDVVDVRVDGGVV